MTDETALEALRRGAVVGVPTDTVYGLAVDAYRPDGVAELRRLKGRSSSQPIALLVATLDQAESVSPLGEPARRLAAEHWPGPLTIVCRLHPGLPNWLGDAARGTIGLRMPNHPVLLELLELAGPLAATSANMSGEQPTLNAESAKAVFGDDVSVYVDAPAGGVESSTVVDVTTDPPTVLRPGPITI
ncbi:MAG: L-threonylcarbamoyladenylate synthase [Acidimicrobiia bacterium]|nr:L-threonylcarbamoyladenylate synthase [Acidimicrobiia bacterium]